MPLELKYIQLKQMNLSDFVFEIPTDLKIVLALCWSKGSSISKLSKHSLLDGRNSLPQFIYCYSVRTRKSSGFRLQNS